METNNLQINNPENNQEKNKTKLILKIFIGVIIVVILGFLLFYFLQGNEKENLQDNSENNLDSNANSALTNNTGDETNTDTNTDTGTGTTGSNSGSSSSSGTTNTETGDTTTKYCETLQAPSLDIVCKEKIDNKYTTCTIEITPNGEDNGNVDYILYEGLTDSDKKVIIPQENTPPYENPKLYPVQYLIDDEVSDKLIVIPKDTLNNEECTNLKVTTMFSESTISS